MNTLNSLFDWMLAAGFRASVLVVLVFSAQCIWKNRLPSRWRYALWLPVLVVLLIPAQPLLPSWLVWKRNREVAVESSATASVNQAQSGDIVEFPDHDNTVKPAVAGTFASRTIRVLSPTFSSQSMNWRACIVQFWISGVIFAGWFVAGSFVWSLRRYGREAQVVANELLIRVEQAAHAVGLRNMPRVLQSPAIASPAVCGFLRPTLLLNAAFPGDLTDEEAGVVLRHELTHIRRGDLAVNALLCGLLFLHWWNPLLWFAFARARIDREAACDADVLRDESASMRATYGHTLLKMEMSRASTGPSLGFVGILQRGDTLRERIKLIISQPEPTPTMKTTTILSIITAAVLGMTKAADPRSSDTAKPETAPPSATTAQKDEALKTETEDILASRMLTPEEEKALGLDEKSLREQKLLSMSQASRMMTPGEMEKFGYNERFRIEEEQRKKEAALHLPSFAQLQPMLTKIKDDQEPTIMEALPHQVFYPEEHASELKKKETVTRHGFRFYKAPVKLSSEDVRKLNALMKHPDSFGPYLAVNGPGGFQPDFSLVWEENGKPMEVQICFGNGGEIKAYHDGVSVYCQMETCKEALKTMLKKYHKNLPPL